MNKYITCFIHYRIKFLQVRLKYFICRFRSLFLLWYKTQLFRRRTTRRWSAEHRVICDNRHNNTASFSWARNKNEATGWYFCYIMGWWLQQQPITVQNANRYNTTGSGSNKLFGSVSEKSTVCIHFTVPNMGRLKKKLWK